MTSELAEPNLGLADPGGSTPAVDEDDVVIG